MVRLEIRLTHVAWRDGRPRFVPAKGLRRLGFKGEDLKRADGTWMDPPAALAWCEAREREIQARRAAAAIAVETGKRLRPMVHNGRRILAVEDLLDAWLKNLDAPPADTAKRKRKRLAEASIKSYRKFDTALGLFDGQLYTAPAEALTKPIVFDLYERLWDTKGQATAQGIIRTLSAAFSWGMRKGLLRLQVNPCQKLGMEALPPRVRCLTPAEVAQLVVTADREGRPEIGDAVLLGVWSGQRQKDRIELVDAGLLDGRRFFRQSKTAAIVEIPQAPQLEARLAAARRRRETWPVQPLNVILDETAKGPFKGDWYRHVFAEIRTTAAKTMPSLADIRDQDLRDTAVTWLARAGCTLMEICAITGHSHASAAQILKHYLAQHRELADNAIAKLVTWYEGQGT